MADQFKTRVITSALLVILFCSVYFLLAPIYFSLLLGAVLGWILFFEWPRFIPTASPLYWLITPLYPVLPFMLMIYLNAQYHALIAPLFLIVALFDTGSYLVGSIAGRTAIAPTISPRKSWQGAVGGYVLATAGISIFVPLSTAATTISFIVCALALVGDLFESWLKRRAQIKDSGNLLPGHGGLLDRFDGIMFAVFFFYCWADWLIIVLRLPTFFKL